MRYIKEGYLRAVLKQLQSNNIDWDSVVKVSTANGSSHHK